MNNPNSSATPNNPSTSSQKSSAADAPSIPKLNLSPELAEFVGLCLSSKVDFLLVGGYALAFHGAPRFTEDIDLLVATNEQNAARLQTILGEFGVSTNDVTERDLLIPGQVIQIGRPPNRVDLLTSIDGVTWEEAWASKIYIDFAGHQCPVIGRDAIIQNKKATARPQDIADVARLTASVSNLKH